MLGAAKHLKISLSKSLSNETRQRTFALDDEACFVFVYAF
jgi:hypothetical protein